MSVKLRYIELPAKRIFNWLNPMNVTCWNAFPTWKSTWWDSRTVGLREKFGRIWTTEFDKITGHFTELEKSVAISGIKHPISVVSGCFRNAMLSKCISAENVFPPEYANKNNQMLYTHTFGGSRLTIAQQNNINVPCVVHDFANIFDDMPEVTSENFKQWFDDKYIFTNIAPFIRIRTHSHITNPVYKTFNNNTRNAQKIAIDIAKSQILNYC